VGKKEFKEEFERRKLDNMSQDEREKKMKEKFKKVHQLQSVQRQKVLRFKPK
jgi:hypothetical protein